MKTQSKILNIIDMKKIFITTIGLLFSSFVFGQGEIITYDKGSFNRNTFPFDSILHIDENLITFSSSNEINTILLDNKDIIRLTINCDTENVYSIKGVEDLHQAYLRKKLKGKAIGNFVAGASFIFLAHPIARGFTNDNNMKPKKTELPADFAKRVDRTYNGIFWTLTGVGMIFEIAGFCKVAKLASGDKIGYGITRNGATVTYTFRKK